MDFANRVLATNWWDELSSRHQEKYLKEHPGSKYGKSATDHPEDDEAENPEEPSKDLDESGEDFDESQEDSQEEQDADEPLTKPGDHEALPQDKKNLSDEEKEARSDMDDLLDLQNEFQARADKEKDPKKKRKWEDAADEAELKYRDLMEKHPKAVRTLTKDGPKDSGPRDDPDHLKDREGFSTDEGWVPDDTEYEEHTLDDEDLSSDELEARERIAELRKKQKKADPATKEKLIGEENELLDKYGDSIAPGRHFFKRTFTDRLAKKLQRFFQKLSGTEKSFFKNGGADAGSKARTAGSDKLKSNKKKIAKDLMDDDDWDDDNWRETKGAMKNLKAGKKLTKGTAKAVKSFGKGLAIACALALVGASGPVLPLIGLVMASDFLKFLSGAAKSIFSSAELNASVEDGDTKMLEKLISAWAEHLKTAQLSDEQIELIVKHLAEKQDTKEQ
jgi:hypothetical protein